MSALSLAVHEYRCGGVFADTCTCYFTSCFQSFFGVVHDEFFAKGIDERFGAPADDELIGFSGSELHRISDLIAPKTARGGDDNGIVLFLFHLPKRNCFWILASHFFKRNKFVENTIVNHQQHRHIRRVILQTEEAFRGIVGLHVVHFLAANHAMILLSVGSKRHTAVEEHFQVRPYLINA